MEPILQAWLGRCPADWPLEAVEGWRQGEAKGWLCMMTAGGIGPLAFDLVRVLNSLFASNRNYPREKKRATGEKIGGRNLVATWMQTLSCGQSCGCG